MFSQVILQRGEMFKAEQELQDCQELLKRMAYMPLEEPYSRLVLSELRHALLFGSSEENYLLLPVGLSQNDFKGNLGNMLGLLEKICVKLCLTEVSCKRSANEFRISHDKLKYPVGIMMLESVVYDGFDTPQFFVVLSWNGPEMVLIRLRSIGGWPSGCPQTINRVQQLQNYFSIGDSSLQLTSTTPRIENNVVYEDFEKKIACGESVVFGHGSDFSSLPFEMTFQGAHFRFPTGMWKNATCLIGDLLKSMEITKKVSISDVLSYTLGDTSCKDMRFEWEPRSRTTFEKDVGTFVKDLFLIAAEFLVPVDPPTINAVTVSWNINEGSVCIFNLEVEGTSALIHCRSTDDDMSSFKLTVGHKDSWIDVFLQRQAHMIKFQAAQNADRLARELRKKAMISLIRVKQHLLLLQQEKKKKGIFFLRILLHGHCSQHFSWQKI